MTVSNRRVPGGVPAWLHAEDRQWVTRHSRSIVFWGGDTRYVHAISNSGQT